MLGITRKMEAAVISVQSIKPLSPAYHLLPPFRLSLIDQLIPTTYSPLVFFYPVDDRKHSKTAQLATQLKWSLSKTLDTIYPLSGRVRDNIVIENYGDGVPFTETRIYGRLSDFLQDPQVELLNGFLPCQPFCQLKDPTVAPVTVQLNVFDCGGIALGVCLSHKLVDGTTASIFLKSWASNASGVPKNIFPNLSDASMLFPSVESVPQRYISNAESSWFSDYRCVTRRFVFHDNAVAALMAKAASKMVEYPTRVQAISGFIWKHALAASRSISGSLKPSVFKEAVNMRSRRLTKPRLSKHSIGNLIQFSMSHFNPEHTEMEMDSLVALIRDGVAGINNEYIKHLTGEDGSVSYFELLNRQEEIFKGNPETFIFAAWNTFGFNDIDFGWGKPIWVGVMGNTSRCIPSIPNLILLNNAGRRNGMEAWMILDEKIMGVFEGDPEFLAYASPNPCISSLYGDF